MNRQSIQVTEDPQDSRKHKKMCDYTLYFSVVFSHNGCNLAGHIYVCGHTGQTSCGLKVFSVCHVSYGCMR